MKKYLNGFIKSVLFLTFAACATQPAKIDNFINEGSCDQALKELPLQNTTYQVTSNAIQAGGVVLSYSATGAAYTAQGLWNVVSVGGTFVLSCAPAIALVAATLASSSGVGHGASYIGPDLCFFPIDYDAVMAPSFGESTYNATKAWRCPYTDPIEKAYKSVASCYSRKGDMAGEENALKSFQAYKETHTNCFSQKVIATSQQNYASPYKSNPLDPKN